MLPHLEDTIVALSSPTGSGRRAIVRLSGPAALATVSSLLAPAHAVEPGRRRCYVGWLQLPGIAAPMLADRYYWPAPRTYTGQELVELHTLSCPPLVELLIGELLRAGARAAQPGEFTLRAFLAGKLDLPRAEAVLGVIDAGSRDELQQALTQLAGGVSRPLTGLREDLLNLLADLEAGLDFAEEDVLFVSQDEQLKQLGKGLAQLVLLQKQLDQRSLSGRPFRVVLVGRPNAGKSSLFNALAGAKALVSPHAGTTRDYLSARLQLEGLTVELIDTAGWQSAGAGIVEQAQVLGRQQAEEADLLLLCREAGQPDDGDTDALRDRAGAVEVLSVVTKADLAEPSAGLLATSAVSGAGLAELRRLLGERARAHSRPALAPSLSRCRGHVSACLEQLRRAHQLVLFEDPPELTALEIRGALEQLGAMVGAVYTDDLLDRIFSRFCIGK